MKTADSAQTIEQLRETTPSRPPARWWQAVVWVLVIGLLGLVAWQMRLNGPLAAGPVGKGEMAPTFEIDTFDGQTIRLEDLRGQVVVINFWASWCIPCAQEAPELENAWRHYKDKGVVFLGVDYVDTESAALQFIERFGVTYPNGPDLGTRISQAYRIRGVPETYFVDKTGQLAFVKIGPTTQAEIESVIDPLLAR